MVGIGANFALDGLPAEVLFTITAYLGGQDLKDLRLCCKRLASIVEPRVFEDIVVVPYQESFERLSYLANHQKLRKYVQGVTYDCRRLAVDDEPKYDPTFTRLWALSTTTKINRFSPVDMTEVLSQRRTLQRTFLSPDSASAAEEEQLRSGFGALVKLQRVVVKGGHDDNLHNTHPARFHQQMVKKAQLVPNTYICYSSKRRVELTLEALLKSGRAISDLRLENVNWLALGPLRNILASVQHLRLCPQNAAPHGWRRLDPAIHDAYREVGFCLNHPVRHNLQNLEIWFLPLIPWIEELEQNDLREMILFSAYLFSSKCHYPGLRKLHIGTYYTYEHDLLEFLTRASPTLRSLSMEHLGLLADRQDLSPATNVDIMVTSPAWIRPPSACWVKVIKFLHSDMNLEHVSFLGTLVSHAQRWICRDQDSAHRQWKDSFDQVSDRGQLRGILNSYPERARTNIVGWIGSGDGVLCHLIYDRQNCLRSRIQRYVIEGGDCPLDSLAVGGQLNSEGYEERLKLGKGDYSWEIISPTMAEAGPTEGVAVG
jgi:hypothetical protein